MLTAVLIISTCLSLLALGGSVLATILLLDKYATIQKDMAYLKSREDLLERKLDALEMGFTTFGKVLESSFEETEGKFQEVKKYIKGVWTDIEGIRRELPENPDNIPRVLN